MKVQLTNKGEEYIEEEDGLDIEDMKKIITIADKCKNITRGPMVL